MAGRRARPGSAVYNFTKFGVHGFSDGLRQEVLHANVRVTVIAPGYVDTELVSHNADYVQDLAGKVKERIGTVLSADDIANAIVYAAGQAEHVDVVEIAVVPTRQE